MAMQINSFLMTFLQPSLSFIQKKLCKEGLQYMAGI